MEASSAETATLDTTYTSAIGSTSRLDALEKAISSFTSPPLCSEDADCLRNLAAFNAQQPDEPYPKRKLAGVLILLHVNPKGGLSVTLTTRSLTLRSHPGETALPGGRYDEADQTVEQTALREANEEIGLPLDQNNLIYITSLPSFTSRTILAVIPVVYFLATSDAPTFLASLVPNPDEVSSIFHLPLRAFLGLEKAPRTSRKSTAKVDPGTEILAHSFEDLYWLKDALYRLHQFDHPSIPSVVSGLTADILVLVGLLGYYGLSEDEAELEEGLVSKRLGFARNASGQMTRGEIVTHAMAMTREQGLSSQVSLKDQRTSST